MVGRFPGIRSVAESQISGVGTVEVFVVCEKAYSVLNETFASG